MSRHQIMRAILIAATVFPSTVQAQQTPAGPPPDQFRFQYVGPPNGGRIAAATGIHGDTLTYYLGAASGGVWKTTDAGRTWTPVFDDQPVQAIGALAVAPSNPNIVWAGTGEAWVIRDSDMMGDGIYKSEDAGKTWTNVGLRETGRIGRIIVHPTDPNTVYACALGRVTGPQQERGVYRTRDGGKTWKRVLFVNPSTGCSGLALDQKDPNTLFAATWEVVLHTWAMFSGGAGSGLYVTHDGGDKWQRVNHAGLPRSPIGKVDVAIAPSDSKRVYMLAQTPDQGSLWRSDDAGASWRVVSRDRSLIGRAGYYIRLLVNPKNPDEVLLANSSMHRSVDGGLTFPDSLTRNGGCGDCHDIWWDLTNPDHWVVTGDGGAGITRNHGGRFTSVTLPIAQSYHVAVDQRTPYWLYSNRQDNGTMRGPTDAPIVPSNVPSYARGGKVGVGGPLAPAFQGRGGGFGGGFGGELQNSPWQEGIGGCESGFTIPDYADPNIIWATCYGNKVTRFDNTRGVARSVQPYMQTLDSSPDAVKYRCHWTAPLAIDPFDHNTVYYGCQVIFRTSNGGQSWDVISPDLSTQDPSKIVSSGGIVGDNLGQFFGEVVFAIAPSSLQRGLIWAGTNDGKVWYTSDAGKSWNDVTKNIKGMPVWGTVRKIQPSSFDAATAYIAVDAHLMDDRAPYIFKTTDLGKTWTRVNGDLPANHPLAYVSSFAENPNRRGMLFAGTGNAFYYSMDDGAHWTQFREGLPAAPVTWIEVQKQYHDVVISTYGRGLFVLRDISRLEQADQVASGDVQFYAPVPGVRRARSGSTNFLFSLKSAADTVPLEILDAKGSVIRTIKVATREGMNRALWDLRYDSPTQVELRTTPAENPHLWDEPDFKGKPTRPVTHWGIEGAKRAGPIALPGGYTARLTVNGRQHTQPFTVIKDASLAASDEDLAASHAAQARVRDALNASAEIINALEIMRRKIEDELKAGTNGARAKELRELDEKALAVELQLLSRSDMMSDDKWFVEPYKAYLNLVWLNGEIGLGAGDMAGGADYRPTDASLETLRMLEAQVAKARADFEKLMAGRTL